MGKEHLNLPGGCFVNKISNNPGGITLHAEFLTDFGFELQQSATLFITQGKIIITTDSQLCNVLDAIEELQFRQDELKQDFEPAIYALIGLFHHSL